MPAERQQTHPLGGLYRLVISRGSHLAIGALTVIAVLFSGYDATKTRPSDGTVWLLGRPSLEVLDVVSRPSGQPTRLQGGDIIVGIGGRIVKAPQTAATELRRYAPGTSVPYLIRRDDRQFIVSVPLTSTRVNMRDYSVNVALALVYLVIGFAVYMRSGNDRAAGLSFLLCLAFALYFMTNLQP